MVRRTQRRSKTDSKTLGPSRKGSAGKLEHLDEVGPFSGGTEGSRPSSSSGESAANPSSGFGAHGAKDPDAGEATPLEPSEEIAPARPALAVGEFDCRASLMPLAALLRYPVTTFQPMRPPVR